MTRKFLFWTLMGLCKISSVYACGAGISTGAYDDLIETALKSSPVVVKAWDKHQAVLSETHAELEYLYSKVIEKSAEGDREKIQEKVLKRIQTEIHIMEGGDASLGKLNAYENGLTEQAKHHKLTRALNYAAKFIGEHGLKMLEGELPEGYAMDKPAYVVFGAGESVYGTGKVLTLTTVLLCMLMELYEQPTVQKLAKILHPKGVRWLDESAVLHITHFPMEESLKPMETSAFYYSDDRTPRALLVPHGGYTPDGHYNEPRYPGSSKAFGPHDCTTWICQLLGYASRVRTRHFLLAYRWQEGGRSLVTAVDKDWETSPRGRGMLADFKVHKIQDPQKDIQPGYLHIYREFSDDKTDENTSLLTGTNGHAKMVLGVRGSSGNNIIGLAYDRTLPGVDGFGIEAAPYVGHPLQMAMIFDICKVV